MKKKLFALGAAVAVGAVAVKAMNSAKAKKNPPVFDTSDDVRHVADRSNGVHSEAVIFGDTYDLLKINEGAKALTRAMNTKELKYLLLTYLEMGFTGLIGSIAKALPEPPTIISADKYVSKNFYRGTGNFTKSASQEAVWKLGYSQASLVPDDVFTGEYYLGGYLLQNLPANTIETVLDDMKVRTIALDDNSGNGISVFATVECIGISNYDVRVIRGRLSEFAKEYRLASINISATHAHSEIDTLGLWNPFFKKAAHNVKASKKGGELKSGVNPEYMELLYTRVAQSIKTACEAMENGKLYHSERDISDYISDTRAPSDFIGTLTRLRFVPDDKESKETIVVNMGAHPYTTGLKTDNSSGKELSADYTAYIEEIVNKAGCNLMFIQGAILGIYSRRDKSNDGLHMERRSIQAERYGREIGRIVLSMTLTKDEIKNNPLLADTEQVKADMASAGDNYTLWYENWEPVEETPVEPILNIRLREVKLTVTNPVIATVGKLNLVNYDILRAEDGSYFAYTEIGYLELGKSLKAVLMPGEFSPELSKGGGAMSADASFSGRAFPYPSMEERVGSKLMVFGLANDEIGYILPDNDYCMVFFNKPPFGDHYQESISFGRYTGSTIVKAFNEMYAELECQGGVDDEA